MSLANLIWMSVAFWLAGAGIFLIASGLMMMWQIIVNGGMP